MTRHELGTVCVQGGWRPKNGEPRQLIGIGKTLLERKLSGVFEHRVVRRSSMLFRGCDDVFRIPHSRHTTVDEEAVRAHPELKVLAESDEAGIFAVSTEGGRQIFFTGHAEYDAGILNAEYRRDRAAGLFVQMRQKSAGSPEGAGTLALRCCARRDSGAQRSFRP